MGGKFDEVHLGKHNKVKLNVEIFTEALASGWTDQPEVWDAMIEDRNLTSHTYQERTAEAVYVAICENYFPQFKLLLERMLEEVQKMDQTP